MNHLGEAAFVHAVVPRSRANGPGERTVIWFQGCTLACPGCFNPSTHAAGVGTPVAIATLLEGIAQRFTAGEIEGVTISGGEPFEQPLALTALVGGIGHIQHKDRTPSIVVFSGYTLAELRQRPDAAPILAGIDVLIDGRYVAGDRLATELRGSRNQVPHLLTSRYTAAQLAATPELEFRIAADGSMSVTGVAPIAAGHLTRRRG
ncbi:MAG: radical SAM protein [Myxococcales bacterium]|nr:radical SAM protein [Myxococcales bacterium]